MHCPECAAAVPPLREFCPQCGTPINRSRRERRAPGPAERPEDELKRNRAKVLVIGAALLLAVGAVGKVSWFGAAIDRDDRRDRHASRAEERPRGAAVVQAEQLFRAYRDDADAADKLYGGREMVVTGKFVRVAPDGHGDPDLRFETSDPEAPLGIDLIRASHAQATELRPGETVTVSCERVNRTGEERWLRNCAIQEVEDSGEAPSSPPPPPAPTAPKR